MYELIPQELKDLDQWVCAEDGWKVPMSALRREAASASDPKTWSFFEQAEWAVSAGHYDHVGFVFNDNGIVGIDIDCGYDDGLMTPLCTDIFSRCHSYTEKSKSGRGIHIFIKGDLPFDGKNNLNGVEIYKSKRFFIMTGKRILFPEIIENQDAIDYVVQTYFSDVPESRNNAQKDGRQRIYNPEWEKPLNGKIRLRPKYPEIREGGRNISLASLAGTMHTVGYTYEDIVKELTYVNVRACNPRLTDREIRHIAESITRYKR